MARNEEETMILFLFSLDIRINMIALVIVDVAELDSE